MQAEPRPVRRWPFWFLAASLAALVVVFLPVAFGHPTVYSGDPRVYSAAMELMFDGELPYMDYRFEHLPLTIIPMALAHVLAVLTGLPFSYPFMIIMLGMVFVTARLVARIADDLGLGDAGLRFVLMVTPMLVIIPFRVDALSVMLAVAGVFYAIRGRETASLAAAIGAVAAKGWPVVLAAADWWRDQRRRAMVLIGATVAMGLLLLATPGFRAGRSFVGVHEETLSGSLVITWRLLLGNEPQIIDSAGALYTEAGSWTLLLNLAVGAVIGFAALTVVRRAFSWQGAVALTGALTCAVLLASPLLSTQFVLWPIPFIALTGSRRNQAALTIVALISVFLTGVWFPGELWWHAGWLTRNLLLVLVGVLAVIDAWTVTDTYAESSSLRNLPV